MKQKDKAKAYDEVLTKAAALYKASEPMSGCNVIIETLFPELAESEDEKIRKWIIDDITFNMNNEPLNDSEYRKKAEKAIVWLKKQTERKQLYIRFGKIPTDEKSKIYHGEIEVGTENGVSVYPAFETDEGDIVLGLSLPITKTTLYTQQHLIEYDNRPCYLVNGDYVGKDTDGQPLINNVSIIKKIDSYRVKEENQNEQEKDILEDAILDGNEDGLIAETIRYKHKKQSEQKPTDKVEPKFHEGEWITNGDYTWKIVEVKPLDYILQSQDGNVVDDTISHVDEQYHSFTIEDAKDGDVLACKDELILFKSYDNKNLCYYCWYNGQTNNFFPKDTHTSRPRLDIIVPATKEQRDLLFQKMKEAGYKWDAEKKELKKIEQKSTNSYCQENCKGFQETGKCFADGECKAKKEAKQKPVWKPSDEQMKYLRFYSEQNNYDGTILTSLYNDLKKLKKE